jgi:hypothetical protein
VCVMKIANAFENCFGGGVPLDRNTGRIPRDISRRTSLRILAQQPLGLVISLVVFCPFLSPENIVYLQLVAAKREKYLERKDTVQNIHSSSVSVELLDLCV